MKFHRCCQTRMCRGCTERPQSKRGESRGAHLCLLLVLPTQGITKIWIFSSNNDPAPWQLKVEMLLGRGVLAPDRQEHNTSLPSQENSVWINITFDKNSSSIISGNEGRRWKIQSLFCTLSIEKEKTSKRNYFYTLEYHLADLYFVSFCLKRRFTPLFLLEWQFNNAWLNIY